ncbi:hypothetical protein SAMN02910413_0279 [Pseudobutyrivibrio sp. C4]|uniref:hypothetical protein n=1 Tax=Pseudobutyrivibrio sp. C4 TaxID=1520803 RepID=UPI0008D4E140|nr:hypothetical protein [Pseudobutyrivibrio sp. C4]SES64831.1 hypothetical protein SAMN02910413_0279 [Pseudobutyrivibrio sp. C4]
MPFTTETKEEILDYCENHLPEDDWYEEQFDFILDEDLRERIIQEFKAIRFAYKLYEGITAEEENLVFEVRNQILAYASIYEAVIENVIETYYRDTEEYDKLTHEMVLKPYSLPQIKLDKLKNELDHDGKQIIPAFYARSKKDSPKVRFADKCNTAEELGLIHSFIGKDGEIVNLPTEIKNIYSYRNCIHLLAEKRKDITYELDLSKKAYRRMRPFIDQIKEKLREDEKIS